MGGTSIQTFEYQNHGSNIVDFVRSLMPGNLRTVFKQGDSLCITIPKRFLSRYGIDAGDLVMLSQELDHLRLHPVDVRKRSPSPPKGNPEGDPEGTLEGQGS